MAAATAPVGKARAAEVTERAAGARAVTATAQAVARAWRQAWLQV